MSKNTWIHRLSKKDIDKKTALCSNCGEVEIRQIGSAKIWKCLEKRRLQRKIKNYTRFDRSYRKHFIKEGFKKCNKCEIQNLDLRFFNVNHKDGDHDNNAIENLELLCPNCHRVETLKQWAEGKMVKYNKNYKIRTVN